MAFKLLILMVVLKLALAKPYSTVDADLQQTTDADLQQDTQNKGICANGRKHVQPLCKDALKNDCKSGDLCDKLIEICVQQYCNGDLRNARKNMRNLFSTLLGPLTSILGPTLAHGAESLVSAVGPAILGHAGDIIGAAGDVIGGAVGAAGDVIGGAVGGGGNPAPAGNGGFPLFMKFDFQLGH